MVALAHRVNENVFGKQNKVFGFFGKYTHPEMVCWNEKYARKSNAIPMKINHTEDQKNWFTSSVMKAIERTLKKMESFHCSSENYRKEKSTNIIAKRKIHKRLVN